MRTARDPLNPATNEYKVYRFIIDFKLSHDGNAPTIREMGDAIGVPSTSQITYYLDKLERAGLIIRDGEKTSRAICLVGGRYEFPSEVANGAAA